MSATPRQRTLSGVATVEPASAVVVRVPVPRVLERLRARWDWAAGVGVPAHVTILFPFLPERQLGPDVRREVATIAAAHEPFEVRFTRVERFPGVIYLAPEPSAPFAHLTQAVVARYPDYPPYGGSFEEVIPHLTIAESEVAPFDEIAEVAANLLPFVHRTSALEVLVEGGEGRWQSRWRLPLGVRP
jgi:2'-5' RNA ligase